MTRKLSTLIAVALIALGCDSVAVPTTGPVTLPPTAPNAPGPEAPDAPPPAATDDPDLLLVVTNGADSLFVASGVTVGVGQRATVPARLVLGADRSYLVIVGQESARCEAGTAHIVGITYTAENSPSFGLSLASDWTAWMEDACTVLGFKYIAGPAGRTVEFGILVEGTAGGETEIRTQMELAGWPGEAFRSPPFFTSIQVVP